MTATDELRRLLDERGVEWWQSANTLGCVFTRWYSPLFGDEVCAMENGEEGLVLFDHFMTPAQAIDATLGRGECHMMRAIPEFEVNKPVAIWLKCSECGCETVAESVQRVFDFCPYCGRRVIN